MRIAEQIAAVFLLAGCASTPPAWLDEPHLVVPIRWVRAQDPPQMEVRDGACVLYMPQTSSRRALDRVAAEPLVERCIAAGGLRPGAGDFDLHWYRVGSTLEAAARADDLYPRRGPASPAALLKPRGGSNRIADGVYWREGRFCVVVTHGTHRLAHELRHCYEGNWHP